MPIAINELSVAGAAAAGSASDVFLSLTTKKAGKVKGEAATTGHTDDIIVFGWSWGVEANTAIGSTAGTARRSYKRLVITKAIDSATTGMMSALSNNDEVKEAKLTMRKAGGDALDYFTMTLNGARIINVDIDVGRDGVPIEKISFAFTKILVEYRKQQGAGISSGSSTFTDEVLPR